jgi:hypothetical protein
MIHSYEVYFLCIFLVEAWTANDGEELVATEQGCARSDKVYLNRSFHYLYISLFTIFVKNGQSKLDPLT